MSLFGEDIIEDDMLENIMDGEDFPRSNDTENDDEASVIEEVTPGVLLDDVIEEYLFDVVIELVKIVRWKKENSVPNQLERLNQFNSSVRDKQEIYQNPNSIIDLPFQCDHCGRKVSTVRYTYHLERCMRRRKRKTKEFIESGSEKDEDEIEEIEESSDQYEILPPPPSKEIENTNDIEVTTEDIHHGWSETVDEDEDDDVEDIEARRDDLEHQELPILGSKLEVEDLEDNDDDGFGITVIDDGSPLTPPNAGGGLGNSPSDVGLDLDGLQSPSVIIGSDDDEPEYSTIGFGRDHDLFGDDLAPDDLLSTL